MDEVLAFDIRSVSSLPCCTDHVGLRELERHALGDPLHQSVVGHQSVRRNSRSTYPSTNVDRYTDEETVHFIGKPPAGAFGFGPSICSVSMEIRGCRSLNNRSSIQVVA